jgi:riboflavin kinase/FMN adenylyltransferase
VLVDGLHVKWLMVGDDFCYGARRAGNVAMLVEAGKQYGFEVETLPTVMHGAQRISSSAVRHALADGDFAAAQALLGHPYSISGHVIHGQKLGRTLGFPTLNLRVAHRPALSGIFVVQVHGLGEKPAAGVASLGVRPTVDDSGRVLLEVHLFDYHVLLRQAGARRIPRKDPRRGKIRRPADPDRRHRTRLRSCARLVCQRAGALTATDRI